MYNLYKLKKVSLFLSNLDVTFIDHKINIFSCVPSEQCNLETVRLDGAGGVDLRQDYQCSVEKKTVEVRQSSDYYYDYEVGQETFMCCRDGDVILSTPIEVTEVPEAECPGQADHMYVSEKYIS